MIDLGIALCYDVRDNKTAPVRVDSACRSLTLTVGQQLRGLKTEYTESFSGANPTFGTCAVLYFNRIA